MTNDDKQKRSYKEDLDSIKEFAEILMETLDELSSDISAENSYVECLKMFKINTCANSISHASTTMLKVIYELIPKKSEPEDEYVIREDKLREIGFILKVKP